MEKILHLYDDQYPSSVINHTRIIARAVVVNEDGKVLLMKLNRNDEFGNFKYYETPGGGVNDNENINDAVLREIKEETGCDCEIITELGLIEDDYNLIYRHNMNYYFLLKVVNYGDKKLEDYEIDLFSDLVWVDIDMAIDMLNNMKDKMIPLLVKRREVPIYQLAKKYLMR